MSSTKSTRARGHLQGQGAEPATTQIAWAWGRPASEVSDRSDRPWENADRRPSHADRRRAVRRVMWEEGFQRLGVPAAWSEKIRHVLAGVLRLVA